MAETLFLKGLPKLLTYPCQAPHFPSSITSRSSLYSHQSLSPLTSSVQPIKPVEKIHLEVNAGPGRHPINARQLLETLRRLSKVSAVTSSRPLRRFPCMPPTTPSADGESYGDMRVVCPRVPQAALDHLGSGSASSSAEDLQQRTPREMVEEVALLS